MDFDINMITTLHQQQNIGRNSFHNSNTPHSSNSEDNRKQQQSTKPKRNRRSSRIKKDLIDRLDTEQKTEHLANSSFSSPSTSRHGNNQHKRSKDMNKEKMSKQNITSIFGISPKMNPPRIRKQRLQTDLSKFNKIGVEQKTASQYSSFSSPSTSSQSENQNATIMSRDNLLKLDFTFITGTHNSPGTYIRSRNKKTKYIKLRSFLKNGMKRPCIFKTDFSFFKLVEDLKVLDINTKEILKITSKKYPTPKKTKRKSKQHGVSKVTETKFLEYITEDEAKIGLENGSFIKGYVRINPKNANDSYVSNEDTSLADYYLTSVKDRNRALDGDEVILKLKPEKEWINGYKTACVVYLKEKVHTRIIVGNLKPSKEKNVDYALLYPRDKRCPLIRISEIHWPNGFKKQPKKFENIIFVGKITNWEYVEFANGVLLEALGQSGDLKVETLSILKEFCLDTTPFAEELKAEHLALSKEISTEELNYRADLRSECIFTIDPETARDLDDAVSVKHLPNDIVEVGVHISDASYFLKEGTELDQLVSKKATTIYLVDNVYHMLPEELCLHCSLLPGQDKLAFSVFWEMTMNGEILNTRFCRSIVRSCGKFSYEQVQNIINDPDKNFTEEEFPKIFNNFSNVDIVNTVKILQAIAINLRQKRVDNGALKIDQTKLLFSLEPETGEPLSFRRYENMAAHRLIEEFMLLANISVAEKIKNDFPTISFLRCHEPPKQTMMVQLKNCLASYGIHLDISSSGAIRSSLQKYETNDYAGECLSAVLNHMVAKAMTRAKYFCSSSVESDNDYKHYALSVPIYTHFTSPIRRYADIMVHRLLAASLGYQDPPEWDTDYVAAIAANCNMQKYNAKRAGEASSELYLAHFVQNQKPYIQDCAVVDVKERSFDAIVLQTGSIIRIYQNNCEAGTIWKSIAIPLSQPDSEPNSGLDIERRQLKLKITFPKTYYFPLTTIDVEVFTMVKVSLDKKNNSYKLEGTLLRPLQTQIYPNKQ